MKKFIPLSKRGFWACVIILLILFTDQAIKIEVKTNMRLYESIRVTDWFYINFIENNGMAYGMTFINKQVLSLFRVIAISLLGYYIWLQVRQKARCLYVCILSVIFAGALGNLMDCMFYGMIFNASSPYYVSYMVPFGQGYSSFLMGKVVDMFYFPLIVTTWPEWVPVLGGTEFVFFSPVFNFADACISVGVVLLMMLCRRELSKITLKR